MYNIAKPPMAIQMKNMKKLKKKIIKKIQILKMKNMNRILQDI